MTDRVQLRCQAEKRQVQPKSALVMVLDYPVPEPTRRADQMLPISGRDSSQRNRAAFLAISS